MAVYLVLSAVLVSHFVNSQWLAMRDGTAPMGRASRGMVDQKRDFGVLDISGTPLRAELSPRPVQRGGRVVQPIRPALRQSCPTRQFVEEPLYEQSSAQEGQNL